MKSTYSINLGEGSKIYRVFQYPAGEWQVRIEPTEIEALKRATEIRISAYGAPDLMRLALLNDAVRGVNSTATRHLILPYLPYARADRRFVPGDCFGLAAFGNLLNSMAFDAVATLDAHSKKSGVYVEHLLDVSPLPLIQDAIVKFARRSGVKQITVLFPDKGAAERYTLPDVLGCNVEAFEVQVLHCKKRRDPATGALSGFDVPAAKEFASQAALIIDDICDGGGTFIGIADALVGRGLQLGLYVTHGIFSKGFGALRARFDRIYSTDSFGSSNAHEDVHTLEAGSVIRAALHSHGAQLPVPM